MDDAERGRRSLLGMVDHHRGHLDQTSAFIRSLPGDDPLLRFSDAAHHGQEWFWQAAGDASVRAFLEEVARRQLDPGTAVRVYLEARTTEDFEEFQPDDFG